MDGKKCHRKTPKNHSKPVKFLTVPELSKIIKSKSEKLKEIEIEQSKNRKK